MRMTQQEWDSMTGPDRAEYLGRYEIKIETSQFVDGGAKVGEATVKVGRRAVCGGVVLTVWMIDEPDTVIAAAREQIGAIAAQTI